jgi:hypothetical protein
LIEVALLSESPDHHQSAMVEVKISGVLEEIIEAVRFSAFHHMPHDPLPQIQRPYFHSVTEHGFKTTVTV